VNTWDNHYVGGAWVPGTGATISVADTVTGQPLGRIPDADAAIVDRAVTAAANAFSGWAGTPVGERAEMLRRIADALVAKGLVSDRSAAFESILHWESGYYEKYYAPSPLEGVRMIVAAGGVPVLAHPATHGRYRVIEERAIAELVAAGLVGLEIHHRDNTEDGKVRLYELAAKYDLVVTGSSDYHGEGKPNRLAENTTEPDALARILAAGSGSVPYRG